MAGDRQLVVVNQHYAFATLMVFTRAFACREIRKAAIAEIFGMIDSLAAGDAPVYAVSFLGISDCRGASRCRGNDIAGFIVSA